MFCLSRDIVSNRFVWLPVLDVLLQKHMCGFFMNSFNSEFGYLLTIVYVSILIMCCPPYKSLHTLYLGHYIFAPSAGVGKTGVAIAELISDDVTPNAQDSECLEFWWVFSDVQCVPIISRFDRPGTGPVCSGPEKLSTVLIELGTIWETNFDGTDDLH